MRFAIFLMGIFAGWGYNNAWRKSQRKKVIQGSESYKHLRVVK